MNGNPLKRTENCFSYHAKGWELLFRKTKDQGSHPEPVVHHLHHFFFFLIFNTLCASRLLKDRNFEICALLLNFACARRRLLVVYAAFVPLLYLETHTSTHTRTTHTREAGISSPSLLCEAAWQTPACRIKTSHQLSFSPHRPGDFMWRFTNLVIYLFISFVIKGLGGIMPLVSSTIL